MVFVVDAGGTTRQQLRPPRPPRARGTSNSNARGSSYARRARKQWLLDTFGDGETAPCFVPDCSAILTLQTITVDRITLGCDGGSYRRDNIRPACGSHNSSEGSHARWARHPQIKKEAQAA
ncbi:hypothetical protein [Pseudolysinimonas sp.]|uniref:hypothetical protein n=1 Tax=Pseudolysinimonas sp. TaxID=2680009 RepID=UPI003F7FA173